MVNLGFPYIIERRSVYMNADRISYKRMNLELVRRNLYSTGLRNVLVRGEGENVAISIPLDRSSYGNKMNECILFAFLQNAANQNTYIDTPEILVDREGSNAVLVIPGGQDENIIADEVSNICGGEEGLRSYYNSVKPAARVIQSMIDYIVAKTRSELFDIKLGRSGLDVVIDIQFTNSRERNVIEHLIRSTTKEPAHLKLCVHGSTAPYYDTFYSMMEQAASNNRCWGVAIVLNADCSIDVDASATFNMFSEAVKSFN